MAKGKKRIELGKKIVEKIKKRKDGKTKISPKAQVRNQTAKTKTPPKRAIPAAAGPIALGAGITGAGIAKGKKNNKGESFDDAFRKARAKGEGTLFTHNGKKYTAVTKDDLKKKGYSTLAEYNRAGGKKKIDIDAAAKKIAGEVNKNKKPKTRKQKRQERRKERIGFETFKERRQARRAARKSKGKSQLGTTGLGGTTRKVPAMKSGGVVSARRSKPRGVGAAKRGFGRALR
jgi:hypothetical protein